MLMRFAAACHRHALVAVLGLAATCAAAPALGQAIQTVDPDASINSDLPPPTAAPPSDQAQLPPLAPPVVTSPQPSEAASQAASDPAIAAAQGDTYKQDDLIGAAEGVFGKGASGLAGILEDILKEQGEPNAYIAGREGSAAIGVGLRYGIGEMFHKVEGKRKVYWTGPSIGFDLGGDASKVFVLVYNLYNTDDLYERFPAGEGQLYFVGGFNASYVRKGNIVLIPIRVGAGLRLGVNAGYLKFTRKHTWLPF